MNETRFLSLALSSIKIHTHEETSFRSSYKYFCSEEKSLCDKVFVEQKVFIKLMMQELFCKVRFFSSKKHRYKVCKKY